jgi:hypothetical protein
VRFFVSTETGEDQGSPTTGNDVHLPAGYKESLVLSLAPSSRPWIREFLGKTFAHISHLASVGMHLAHGIDDGLPVTKNVEAAIEGGAFTMLARLLGATPVGWNTLEDERAPRRKHTEPGGHALRHQRPSWKENDVAFLLRGVLDCRADISLASARVCGDGGPHIGGVPLAQIHVKLDESDSHLLPPIAIGGNRYDRDTSYTSIALPVAKETPQPCLKRLQN